MERTNAGSSCGTPSDYIGVRKRKNGRWVSEIRVPKKDKRIWLGSFETEEMAAAAHDVAALHFRGRGARVNFPHLVGWLPKPASSNAEDICEAAQEAAKQVRNAATGAEGGGGTTIAGPVTVNLPSEIQAISECPLYSPNMWMHTSEDLMFDDSTMLNNDDETEWDEMQSGSLWDH